MDARGNKLSSCKIPDQYLKNKKNIKLLELWTLWLKKGKKERKNGENSEYKRVVITNPKKVLNISRLGARAARWPNDLAKPEKLAEFKNLIGIAIKEYKLAELAKLGKGAEEFGRIR